MTLEDQIRAIVREETAKLKAVDSKTESLRTAVEAHGKGLARLEREVGGAVEQLELHSKHLRVDAGRLDAHDGRLDRLEEHCLGGAKDKPVEPTPEPEPKPKPKPAAGQVWINPIGAMVMLCAENQVAWLHRSSAIALVSLYGWSTFTAHGSDFRYYAASPEKAFKRLFRERKEQGQHG